jgi:hypothetical protein
MTEYELLKLLSLQGDLEQTVHQLESVLRRLREVGLEKVVPTLVNGPQLVESLKVIHQSFKNMTDEELKKLRAKAV